MSVTTHTEADALLGSRTSRKIANHTYLQRRDRNIAVRYHDTDIVTFHPDMAVTLDTGGWLTESTRERMNTFTPREVQVFTTKGRWYVTRELTDKGTLSVPDYAGAVAYADGVLVYPDGTTYGHLSAEEVDTQDRHNRQVNRLIDRWLKRVEEVGRRLSQACVCAMCVRTGVGTIVGDQFQDVSHLLAHLTDLEYPRGLILTATENRYPRYNAYEHNLPPWDNATWDMAKRAVRLYLRQRLYTGPVSLAHGRRPQFAPSWALTLHQQKECA